MGNSDGIYKKLSKQYTDQEIVEGFVFNETLNVEEQSKVDRAFREERLNRLKSMSDEERRYGNLLQMKYLLLEYFSLDKYDAAYSFSSQLKKYIEITGKSSKKVAEELSLHPTRLSRLSNGREHPNVELMYRLEEHSRGELPAHFWWKVYSIGLEHEIRTDLETKLIEANKVKHRLDVRA